jgi:hypothetical protein
VFILLCKAEMRWRYERDLRELMVGCGCYDVMRKWNRALQVINPDGDVLLNRGRSRARGTRDSVC